MKLSRIIPHHEAVQLKKMGFNTPVAAYYHESPCDQLVTDCVLKDFNNDLSSGVVMISAPTIEVAEQWLNGYGKIGVSTLASLVSGEELNVHQKADAIIEFNRVVAILWELEKRHI